MQRIMIIAGGEWQVPLVEKAKEMGLFVVNSNLYEDSPAFKKSDVSLVADVLDRNTNLYYAKKYNLDAVVTDQSDIAVTTVAYIAEQLGLPGIGSDAASLFTNKYLMRTFCKEHGFPVPDFKLCKKLEDTIAFLDKYQFPVVIKPLSNQSSRGVAKVNSPSEIEGAFCNAKKHSITGEVLIEKFIGGVELSIDGIKLNHGGHYSLAISKKTHYMHNEMVAKSLLFTNHDDDIDLISLKKQHDRLISSMSLPFGLTHAEYKYDDGRFYLIETAARGGGTNISSHIVPLMSGIDSNQLLIRMSLGDHVLSITPKFTNNLSMLYFFEFKPGKVKEIIGLKKIREIHEVISFNLNFDVGDEILPPIDDRSRHGYLIIVSSDLAGLNKLLKYICQLIEIHYE